MSFCCYVRMLRTACAAYIYCHGTARAMTHLRALARATQLRYTYTYTDVSEENWSIVEYKHLAISWTHGHLAMTLWLPDCKRCYILVSYIQTIPLTSYASSVLPSILKACRPYKSSAQTLLWCGKGRRQKALMWPQATPKPHPPIMPWIILGESSG